MTTPNKVEGKNVGVYANAYLLSRVQSVSADTDLGEEEARELTNSEVVEYTSTDPQVSITIETNDYASVRNLRAIAEVTGGAASDKLTISNFSDTTCDIGIMVAEDSVIKRTAIFNKAALSSIAWNYDVGGVATEAYTFETDNKTWYLNAARQTYSFNDIGGVTYAAADSGSCLIPLANASAGSYTGIKVYIDGIAVTGAVTLTAASPYTRASWVDTTAASGTSYRVLVYKTSPDTTIPQTTSTSTIGSIPRGKLDIYLSSGAQFGHGSNNTTNFLRLQSVSIDVDLARNTLNELGHYRAVERSLETPVPVNVTFSALSADLEQFAVLSNINFGTTSDIDYDITQFAKVASLQVRYFDKQDTDTTRALRKSITISGLQVVSESFAISVGDNATQDFSCRASNVLISGLGTPGQFPLTATPSD